MRVLHIIDKLTTGGAEQVFVDITYLLVQHGVAVDALLFDGSGNMMHKLDKRLKVHILHRDNKFSLRKMWELHKICSRYDIVHVHMRHCYQYVRLVQLMFFGRYKLIVHDHYGSYAVDTTVPTGFKGLFKPQYYIGVCLPLVEWAKASVGIDSDKAFLLRNIVLPKQPTAYPRRDAHRAMLVANISRIKHIDYAIGLAQKMKWQLDVYGNVRDEAYHRELTEQIGTDNTINIISNVTGFTELYGRYSMAIHSAKSESGPLVLMEYMAAGLPFIANKTGEVADVVAADLPVLFMDSFDMDKWEERINEIQRDSAMPEKMKAVFEKYFSADKYLEKCMEIYRKVSC